MEIKEFEKLAICLDNFNVSQVKDFELMTDKELVYYQIDLEGDTGNLSDWDHIRAFFTMKAKVMSQREVQS